MRILIILFFAVLFSPVSLGAQQLKFEETALVEVLHSIEQNSEIVFNFDANLLEGYTYSGSLDLNDSTFLSTLLYELPFSFEKTEQTILIFLPPKQEIRLCGYLKSKEMGFPIYFANVFAAGTTKGVQTDEAGYFDFEIACYKNQKISLSCIGFNPKEFLALEMEDAACPVFYLSGNEDLLGVQIVVEDYIIRGVSEGESFQSILVDYEQISKNHRSQELDVLKTIQHLPGITSLDESACNLTIRGATPDQNLVLWEQIPMYDPGHFFGMVSSINPFVVDEVQVFKSSFEPSHGNTIGGVVDVSLPDEIPEKISGGVGISFTDVHAHLSLPIYQDKLSLIVTGRRSIADVINSPTINSYFDKVFQSVSLEEGDKDKEEGIQKGYSNMQYFDWNAKLIFKPSDRVSLQSSWIMAQDAYAYEWTFEDSDIDSDENYEFVSKGISNRIKVDWNPQQETEFFQVYSDFYSSQNYYLRDREEDNISNNLFSENGILDNQLGVKHRINLEPNLTFKGGYTYEQKKVNYFLEEISLFEGDYLERNEDKGLFHNFDISLGYQIPKLSIEGGLRSTIYQGEGLFFSPRLSLQYLLHENLKVRFASGRFYQFISQIPFLNESEIGIENDLWVLTANELDEVLHADKISLGFVFKKDRWLIDLEGYFHQNEGVLALSSSPQLGLEIDESGTSQIKGLELLVNKNWSKYKFWLNYALSKNTMRFPSFQANDFPAPNDHRHQLSLTNDYVFKNWQFSATYQYRTGLPFSTPSSVGFEIDEDDDEKYFYLEYASLNEERLTDYHRVDVGLTYKKSLPKLKSTLECSLSILNLLNRKNSNSRRFYLGDIDDDEDDLEILALDKYLLGITPQFMVRMYW